MNAVSLVAAESFITAIARQGDFHVFARQARDEVRRKHRGVAKGLFQVAGQLLDTSHQIGINDQFLVVRAEFLRDHASVRRLVEIAVTKPDREGLDRLRHAARHQRDDRGGVRSATQQCPQRDIGDKPDANRFL